MLRISACVITKNEEKNIRHWLDGVRELASEIIVVDTGSEDRTVELAKAGGAEVYFFPWCGDFSAAKNFALDKATGDWIVFLDADEMFSTESIPKVRRYVEKFHSDHRIVGIVCQLFNIDVDDGNRLIDKAYQMRVFRHERSLRYQGRVHEMICNQAIGIRKLQMTDLVIYHTGYSKKLVKEKCQRNLVILQEEVQKAGKEMPNQYPYFVDIYMGLGDYEKVIHYARLALKEKSGLVGMESKAYRRLLDAMLLLKKDVREREKVVEEAIAALPDMPEFLWDKGILLYGQKKYQEAKQCFLQALQQNEQKKQQESAQCMTDSMDARKPYFYLFLGLIARLEGKPAEAMQYFVKGLRLYPYDYGLFGQMYQLLRNEPTVDIIAFLDTLYDKKRDIGFLMQALRQNWAGAVYIYYSRYWKNTDEDYTYAAYMAAGRFDAAVVAPEMKMRRLLPLGLWSCLNCSEIAARQVLPVVLPPLYQKVYAKIQDKKVELDEEGQAIYDSLWRMEGHHPYAMQLANEKAAAVVDAAVHSFSEGQRLNGIRQLMAAYKEYPASSLLAYGLASLLQANGDWNEARKVLLTVRFPSVEVRELWAELQQDAQYPLVSILIPTYNRPALFELTLRSACAQTYTNLEILVCDNSTNDDTERIMQGYQDNLRVCYVHNRDTQTKADNFQSFAGIARGEFLQWCMDDDILAKDKIRQMLQVFQEHPEITLVTSARGLMDEEGINRGQWDFPLALENTYQIFSGKLIGKLMLRMTTNFLGEPSAVLFRRQDLQHHYWRAECRGYQTLSDVAMWLELLHQGDCVVFREPLSYYRRHKEQEGQHPNVVLLSRLEWYRLIEEEIQNPYFLSSSEDVQQALETLYHDSESLLLFLRQQDAGCIDKKLLQEYQKCIADIQVAIQK